MEASSAPLPKIANKTSQRIDVRLREEQKIRLEQAAATKGVSLTDFIVQNALEVVNRTIREHETWELEHPDAEAFFSALIHPPKPTPRLMRYTRRYQGRYLERK